MHKLEKDRSAPTVREGGIPRPSKQDWEGLPCEGDLLSEASSQLDHNYRLYYFNATVQPYPSSDAVARLADTVARRIASLQIAKGSVLALDIGSASCGYALVQDKRIVFSGVRLFAPAATNHKHQSRQRHRRQARAIRVRLRRHRLRRAAIRHLLIAQGLPDPLAAPASSDPHVLRSDGLDRRLAPAQWSAVLYQIAKRRGDGASGAGSVGGWEPSLAAFRTIGEMRTHHPHYADRKRNRSGAYVAVLSSALHDSEVRALFAAQRAAGNPYASESFETEYIITAFAARGRADGEGRVGACPFLPDRRRGARCAPSVERYLFLDALTKLKLVEGDRIRRLTAAELAIADARFGTAPSVSYADLGAWLGWERGVRLLDELPPDADIVAPAGAAAGTVALRQTIGAALARQPALADAVMAVIAFRNTPQRIRDGLQAIGLAPGLEDAVMDAHAQGRFAGLRGAARLSAEAAAAMVPHLARGDLFHDAAIAAGLNPRARESAMLNTIQNPCVVRAVLETLRQVQAVVQAFGYRPEHIHIETAEDLAASGERRAQLAAARAAAHRRWEGAKVALAGMMPPSQIRSRDMERYLLWQEQQGRCVYSGVPITIRQLLDGTAVQVDHILPRFRSGDNSRHNRVVCLAKANQDKGERTPFEWRGGDTEWWGRFQSRIEGSRLSPQKQRNLLVRQFAEREGRILRRNLDDTRYAMRCVVSALGGLYPEGQRQRHLVTRPGHVTAALRRAWGLNKDRNDPRHHALDAVVLATAGHKTVAALHATYRNGLDIAGRQIPLPWPGFADDLERSLGGIVPSRSEARRGRGQAHGMTVRRAKPSPSGGTQLYERRPVWKLRLRDLDRIPDPEMNQRTIQCLKEWIEAGRPEGRLPVAPSGAPIRRVRLLVTGSTGLPREGLPIRGGVVAFGEVVRLDIYCREGRFHPVPVYRTDIATRERPPSRAIVPGALREHWQELGEPHGFRFSLYHGSFVEIVTCRGAVRSGFVRSFDSYKSQILVTPPHDISTVFKVGINSAVAIRKYAVDRIGRLSEIPGEALT